MTTRTWPIPPSWARRCPLCTQYDGGGVDEAALWVHLACAHDAASAIAAVFADLDIDDLLDGRWAA